ncbi:S-adenosyl-L-methionine-dependent methyltransferase [Microdochium bolleyi]|uniref:S-adenosyl-L-methionine-dependent methyltransferase n=1 Tax=Microdochium bolleyi TaxID=196109 RepID=A0A136J3W6_9PEZI|nr:S-adenosyl-L-methionine-dependent methyltransferase [Microdochium bolleyi]
MAESLPARIGDAGNTGVQSAAAPAIRYLPTSEAYDRWAAVYDTDGNFLQKLDDWEMERWLFPQFLAALRGGGEGTTAISAVSAEEEEEEQGGFRVVDLGCGTGRNTALLILLGSEQDEVVRDRGVREIVALDASLGMLEVAKGRLLALDDADRGRDGRGEEIDNNNSSSSSSPAAVGAADQTAPTVTPAKTTATTVQIRSKTVTFDIYDILAEASSAASSTTTLPQQQQKQQQQHLARPADGIISTLVVEHTPLAAFFSCASRLLKPGGVLLLTNMHAHMGGISQAGFVDGATGEKVRPAASYAHTVQDVVAEARRWGMEVVMPELAGEEKGETGIREVAVNESMVERLGIRSRKWVGVTCWFGGLFRKVS